MDIRPAIQIATDTVRPHLTGRNALIAGAIAGGTLITVRAVKTAKDFKNHGKTIKSKDFLMETFAIKKHGSIRAGKTNEDIASEKVNNPTSFT